MTGELNNRETIFTILTALVKKSGGELRISEEDLCKVKTSDLVTLLWDDKTSEIVLQTTAISGGMLTKKPTGGYNN